MVRLHVDTTRAQWGQAVGDAFGTTFEFQDELGIATREPSAWPGEMTGAGPFALLPGQVTDDTELALALARSLMRRGRYDQADVAAAYVRWRAFDPFDVGGATHQAFGAGMPRSVTARSVILTLCAVLHARSS